MDSKWRTISCGCCGGIEWGGEEPRECRDCNGSGTVFIRPNGATAMWPGGKFTGMLTPKDYERGTPYADPADVSTC